MTQPLLCVAPHLVSQLWPVVLPMLEIAYRTVDEPMPDDTLKWLEAERGLLWVAYRNDRIIAALTTMLIPKPSGLACRMIACGGSEMTQWRECHAQIEEYAKAEGCVRVISKGRPGWARVLHGYKVVEVSLEKVIADAR